MSGEVDGTIICETAPGNIELSSSTSDGTDEAFKCRLVIGDCNNERIMFTANTGRTGAGAGRIGGRGVIPNTALRGIRRGGDLYDGECMPCNDTGNAND